jgi:protein-S-isoprenylcysteine O-methyltransferase Ste14
MSDDETLADIDLSLLDIQQDLVRIVVLVSSVLVLQGLTFLILAWIANGFVVSILIGGVGAIVLIIGLGVWIGNFRAYGTVALKIDEAKGNHPAVKDSDETESS